MTENNTNLQMTRSGGILQRTYAKYMLPATLTAVGIALSEFVDCMVVGQLLDSNAFVIVTLCMPIILLVCTIYNITGVGGSLLYAESLGNKDTEKADAYFTVSCALALVSGTALFLILTPLKHVLGPFIGCPPELLGEIEGYILLVCVFAPIGTMLMHISYFLPIVGMPYVSTGIIVATNVWNVIADVVFIKYFDMGCAGAAAATLASYTLVLAATLIYCKIHGMPFSLRKPQNVRKCVSEIVQKGLPSGVAQLGFFVTMVCCNNLMNEAFGLTGVTAMALFLQMDSMVSIAYMGILNNDASFVAMLKGEGDYYGIRKLNKQVAGVVFLTSCVFAVFLVAFLPEVAALFNITDAETLTLLAALAPIYVLYYPPRGLLLLLRCVYSALDRNFYALCLGLLDKTVSLPVVGGILFALFGGYGVVAAFPVSIVLVLLLVLVVNRRIVKKSGGRYSPILLLDERHPLKALCSFTFALGKDADVSRIARGVAESMNSNSVDKKLSGKICLAVEEMCLYTQENTENKRAADLMVSSDGEGYVINFRVAGKPFRPFAADDSELTANERLLKNLFKIKHEFIFGLNSTSLTISNKEALQ